MNEDNSTAPDTSNEPVEGSNTPEVPSVSTAETVQVNPDTTLPHDTTVLAPTTEVKPSAQPEVTPSVVAPTTDPQPATIADPLASNVGPAPVNTSKPKFSKSKWFLPAMLAGFLVLGGGAAAYLTVFKKTPESAWKSALSNTASGIEKYIENSYNTEQKGFKIDGNFKVSSPIAIDGSMEGQWLESNGMLKADVGASGARINTELRTIGESGATPDLYLKIDGLEGVDDLVASFGGPEQSGYAELLSSINDQWFFIDHTLIDQYTASADSSAGLELTEEDAKEITNKVMAVLKDRMFSTQEDKAVFNIAETLGKEDFEGTSSFKMRVQVNKENFKQFITALKDSVKDTKAEEILKTGNPDATLEEVLDFDSLLKSIDDTDFSKGSADVWVEANGGFIRNVRFYPVEGKENSNYLDFGMNYTGGDVFPFQIKAVIDDEGSKGTVTFGLDVNQANGDSGLSFGVDLNSGGASFKAEGKLNIKGSSEAVTVVKPEGAKNIFELLGGFQSSLMGGAALDPGYDDSQLQGFELDSGFDDTLPLDDSEL